MYDAIFMMGGLGLIIGAGLAAASKIFYVYVDPKILAIDDALPGANCGACGLPGCSANAEAIVAGKAAPSSCVVASPDEIVVIAGIMGVSVEVAEPDVALPGCYFGLQDADSKYIYAGVEDCRAVALHGGGMKVCTIGCLGLGTCARSCPFDAITMGERGLPVVDEKKCTGCGTCERVCPKHIITLSSVTRRVLREYTTDECTTPCQRGCPAGINIREYIHQIAAGDNHRAIQIIKERNPFPTVIGRICPRPCELDCRRNFVDEPVAINFLKRYAADYEFEKKSGEHILPYKAPSTGRKVAIVGGGVEGLSAAFFTARLGHDTTVFEATSNLGGLLRVAIAKERLPLKILDWDIDGIMAMGVEAETGKTLGKDFTIESLLEQGFDALLLAAGGWDSRLTRGTVADLELPIPGTFMFMDFLRFGTENAGRIACESDAVISGGGLLALDAAKVCRDLGAENITVVLRETIDDSPITDADIEALGIDGLNIIYTAGVNKLTGEENRLTGIEILDLNTREKTLIPAETLVIASGRFPELIFSRSKTEEAESKTAESQTSEAGIEVSASDDAVDPDLPIRWEGIQPYKQPASKDRPGLFAEGDVLADYGAAIKAIGAGRRAAVSIHQHMYGIDPVLSRAVVTPDTHIQDVDHVEGVERSRRQVMPIASGRELELSGEIEKGFTREMAQKEAERCLQCGLICYNRSGTVLIQEEGAIAAG